MVKLFKYNPINSVMETNKADMTALLNNIRAQARKITAIDENTVFDNTTLYYICDYYLQQHGRIETRDIFVYREGFYRGLAMSCLILSISLTIRAICYSEPLPLICYRVALSRIFCCVLSSLALLSALLFYRRYDRFAKYRVENTLYSFLAITNQTTTTEIKP